MVGAELRGLVPGCCGSSWKREGFRPSWWRGCRLPSPRPDRALLRLAGFELESKRLKTSGARDGMAYRVVPIHLPTGADPERLQQAWRDQLAGKMGSLSL